MIRIKTIRMTEKILLTSNQSKQTQNVHVQMVPSAFHETLLYNEAGKNNEYVLQCFDKHRDFGEVYFTKPPKKNAYFVISASIKSSMKARSAGTTAKKMAQMGSFFSAPSGFATQPRSVEFVG